MARTVKVGIIGCGKIAQVRHIPEYAEHKDAKLLGFYDINQERARELAKQHGAVAYETVEELLANPENLTPEEKQNLQELLDGITEDDNTFILYGKI